MLQKKTTHGVASSTTTEVAVGRMTKTKRGSMTLVSVVKIAGLPRALLQEMAGMHLRVSTVAGRATTITLRTQTTIMLVGTSVTVATIIGGVSIHGQVLLEQRSNILRCRVAVPTLRVVEANIGSRKAGVAISNCVRSSTKQIKTLTGSKVSGSSNRSKGNGSGHRLLLRQGQLLCPQKPYMRDLLDQENPHSQNLAARASAMNANVEGP